MTNILCNKWLLNKYINPETNRKITEKGAIFKKYAKLCLKSDNITQKKTNDKITIKINKKTDNKITIKINKKTDNKINKKTDDKIAIKINKKTDDKINKKTDDKITIKTDDKIAIKTDNELDKRLDYFRVFNELIKTIQKKYKNNCFRLYNTKPEFRIGNRIILTDKIGTDSVTAIVFKGYYRKHEIKSKEFAVKIVGSTKSIIREIKILEELTEHVIINDCPHYPITYGILQCNKSLDTDSSYYSEESNNSLQEHRLNNLLFPAKFNKYKNTYAIINELAIGDFKKFIEINYNNDILMLNAYSQILISLMFFHLHTNAHHNDSHYGNFLFHKIKPGGYFHYKINDIDYYLENIGYLWVIWDFDNIVFFNNSKTINNKLGYNMTTKTPIKYIPVITIPIVSDFDRFSKFMMNTITEYPAPHRWELDGEKKITGLIPIKTMPLSQNINNFAKKIVNVITKKEYATWENYNLITNLNNDLLDVLYSFNIITKMKPSLQIINTKPFTI
jgi:hypothetical protein